MAVTVAERVANGIKWFDENVPDWRSRIDLQQLDVSSLRMCPAGQVFAAAAEKRSGYDYMQQAYDMSDPDMISLGLLDDDDSYTELEREWRRQLSEPATEPASEVTDRAYELEQALKLLLNNTYNVDRLVASGYADLLEIPFKQGDFVAFEDNPYTVLEMKFQSNEWYLKLGSSVWVAASKVQRLVPEC